MATIQLHKHKHSKKPKSEPVPQEFIEDCKDLAPDFEKTRPKVNRIYTKWLAKGKKPRIIGKWFRLQLKPWYSYQAIRDMLPEEAHRPYDNTGRLSGNRPRSKHAKLQETCNMATSSTQESQKETEKIGSVRNEPTKTHQSTKPGKFNQGADEYEIDEIDQYDIDYLRIIVRWLHQLRQDFIKEAFKWQTKFDDMQREKRALVKTLEDHGIKI